MRNNYWHTAKKQNTKHLPMISNAKEEESKEKKMGKLPREDLQKLLGCIRKDPRVLVPPLPGYDAGVHFIGDKCIVVSTDPCIDVPEDVFKLSIKSFDVEPSYITLGETANITWSVIGAKSIWINHGIGNVSLSGSYIIKPTITTVYTLIAYNESDNISCR